MKWKRILTLLLVFLFLAGCGKETEQAEEPGSTTDQGTELDTVFEQTEYTTIDQTTTQVAESQSALPLPTLGAVPSVSASQSLGELLAAMEGIATSGTAIFTSPADPDTFDISEYNGEDLEFYYQIGAGSEAIDYGIGFALDGMYQDIQIERNGVVSDFAKQHIVHVEPGTSPIYKIRLRPSTGKAGEVVKFQNATILNPTRQASNESETLRGFDIYMFTTAPIAIRMNRDAPTVTQTATAFSGATVGEYTPIFLDWVYISNQTDEYCRSLICYSLEDILFYSDRGENLLQDT